MRFTCPANSSPRPAKFSTAFSIRSSAVAVSIATPSVRCPGASATHAASAATSAVMRASGACFSSAARSRIWPARSRKFAMLGWWPDATLFHVVLALPTLSRRARSAGSCGAPSPLSSKLAGTVPASWNTSWTLRTCSVAGRAPATANSTSRIRRSATVAEPSISRFSCCSIRFASRPTAAWSATALAKSASKNPSAIHQNARLAGLVWAASTAATAARMSSTPVASFFSHFSSPR